MDAGSGPHDRADVAGLVRREVDRVVGEELSALAAQLEAVTREVLEIAAQVNQLNIVVSSRGL